MKICETYSKSIGKNLQNVIDRYYYDDIKVDIYYSDGVDGGTSVVVWLLQNYDYIALLECTNGIVSFDYETFIGVHGELNTNYLPL